MAATRQAGGGRTCTELLAYLMRANGMPAADPPLGDSDADRAGIDLLPAAGLADPARPDAGGTARASSRQREDGRPPRDLHCAAGVAVMP